MRCAACALTELFKWLAEYTRRTPWCYVFLENTSTAGLFPESIDRLVTNPTSQFKSSGGADSERGSDATMRVVTVTFETIKSPRLSYLAYPARSKVSRTRLRKNFIADFNVTFIAALTATKSPVILLSGAPGIGKSHFMKFFRARRTQNSVLYVAAAAPAAEGNDGYGGASESKDCHGDPTATTTPCSTPPYVFVDPEVDGSDDIFTRVALRDVLRMKADTCTVTDGVKIVLIVDEVSDHEPYASTCVARVRRVPSSCLLAASWWPAAGTMRHGSHSLSVWRVLTRLATLCGNLVCYLPLVTRHLSAVPFYDQGAQAGATGMVPLEQPPVCAAAGVQSVRRA